MQRISSRAPTSVRVQTVAAVARAASLLVLAALLGGACVEVRARAESADAAADTSIDAAADAGAETAVTTGVSGDTGVPTVHRQVVEARAGQVNTLEARLQLPAVAAAASAARAAAPAPAVAAAAPAVMKRRAAAPVVRVFTTTR